MADGKERPIHENHRARMQERVAHNGMESLAEHEVLEYMLYLAIPRQIRIPWRTGSSTILAAFAA